MYESEISAAAAASGIRPELLTAIIQHESNFDQNAVGDNGLARGLGQMHKVACLTIGASWDDMFDPLKAIPAVAEYLSFCQNACHGDEWAAVMAYNQGPTVIARASAYVHAVYALIPSS